MSENDTNSQGILDRLERVKILSVPTRHLIELLNFWRTQPSFITLPVSEAIPEGTVVINVCPDAYKNSMDLIVHHPSFEPVPPGVIPPHLPFFGEWRTIPFPDHVTEVAKWPKLYRRLRDSEIILRLSETEWKYFNSTGPDAVVFTIVDSELSDWVEIDWLGNRLDDPFVRSDMNV